MPEFASEQLALPVDFLSGSVFSSFLPTYSQSLSQQGEVDQPVPKIYLNNSSVYLVNLTTQYTLT